MAIYRGTGGAGDATNDVTITEVTEKALEASNSAAAAANSATDAATSASNASTSETNAATSATNAANSATASANSATASASTAAASAASKAAAETAETNAETAETNAASSASSASTSETNAANSATASANSATASANSATASSTSETNAATSESNAATSETNAATSETNAATSATTASTQAGNAASSATAASASAASASNSAAAASVSATAAQTAQTAAETAQAAAETAETNAETAETNAETAETNAAASASAASTSETNAATSASTATTQATASANSASAAATSETNASTLATQAASSAASAAAVYDSFDDRYLGSKTTDPSLDNDGDALVEGTLYFNTTASVLKVYDGSSWDSIGAGTLDSITGLGNTTTNDITTGNITISGGTGPAQLDIIADSDNINEADTAGIRMSQDGGLVVGTWGFDSYNTMTFSTAESDSLANCSVNFIPHGTGTVRVNGNRVLDVTDGALIDSNNLSDLSSVVTARTNLGLGTAATTASTAYATAAQGTTADAALPSTSYTAADVLTKIKTVDGSGSGLDADLLDGQQGSYYLDYNNFTNTPSVPTAVVRQVKTFTLTGSFSTSSSSFTNTGKTFTITPLSTTSKLIIMVDATVNWYSSSNTSDSVSVAVYKSSTRLGSSGNGGMTTHYAGNSAMETVNILTWDSPASTSAQTYNIYLKKGSGNTAYLNSSWRGQDNVTTVVVWEVEE
jgi:hypothetical protein